MGLFKYKDILQKIGIQYNYFYYIKIKYSKKEVYLCMDTDILDMVMDMDMMVETGCG